MLRTDRFPAHKPREEPTKPPGPLGTRAFPKRFASIWWDSGSARVLAMHKLRKGAEDKCRAMINDAPSDCPAVHFYIWDTRRTWNPDDIACWTPIAARPRDQWWEGREDTESFSDKESLE